MKRLDNERVAIKESPLPPEAVSLALIRRAPVLRGAPSRKSANKAPPKSNSVGPRAPSASSEMVKPRKARRSNTDGGPRFMRETFPKIMADAQKRGHGAGYLELSTPIAGWFEILKSYVVKDLNAGDRAKLAALDSEGYKYEVSAEMKGPGQHYWRLKVLVQNPL